ncbi:MAG: ABC transporter substrate-binding protein [Candidatus Taylorbacteria bacterium]|nr:ABC transporter substrate-binding protein [Candidatus Taylorbacteria bacterium]
MTYKPIKELRISGGSTILEYLKKFSATEKVVFGVLVIGALVTAITMTANVNSYFKTEVPANGGTLREGLVGLPHTVNPILAVTDVDRDIASLVYAGLTKLKNNKIEPDLASRWEISSDGLTYIFYLKPDLIFQNGTPLTTADVIFTINKVKDYALKSPRAADWSGITAEATSPTTIKFTLKQPNGSFLANTTLGIIPQSIWGNVSNEQFIFSEYNVKPIGAGSYKVLSIKRDQGGIPTEYHLEAWSGNNENEPHLTNIIFSFYPDLDHALDALTSGSIDSLSSIPPGTASDLATNKGEPYEVEATPLTRIFGVFFNQNKNPVLAEIAVRRALDMSVNRDAIIGAVLNGYGVPIQNAFPIGFDIGTSTKAAPQDILAAKSLLVKSGWKVGAGGILERKVSKSSATTTLAFTLYTADTPDLKQTAELLRSQWQKLGANVTVKVLPPTELYQNIIRTREYDALLFGQVVGKSSDLYAFWHSSQRNSPGLNVSMYTNSKADKILENIKIATSTVDRITAYGQLNKVISDDKPAVFIYSPELVYVVPKKLQGFMLGVANAPSDRFQFINNWYMETEKVWNFFVKK